ncbi:PfkB family carbohydrate kinase [Galbitalea soli]|uniref:Carbohydrate kinase PfkB domain-containing protein n=1 Tax=Galbitalea soli TaxID=1268042 RepID=A0A7C9PMQ6_9MICO|nr:hypothetical protein [Galbitalea soli]NYJ29674.1 sugar/nucleoside kinase (ribokinase family) [Galbitalea soli]
MADTPARVVVFGDVIDDIVVVPRGEIRVDTDTPSSIVRRAGGSAANAASWLAAAGVPVDFVGRVAADDVERHSALLARHGVTPHLHADPSRPTGTIVVVVAGERRTFLTERGANDALTPDEIGDELLAGTGILHLTGYSLFGRPADDRLAHLLNRATAAGVLVSVDPGSAGYLADFGVGPFLAAVRGAHYLFPNRDEGAVLTGEDDPLTIARALSALFPVVALTLGTEGVVLALRGAEPELIPIAPTATVDPTGAGDAFCAGFLAATLGGAAPRDAALAGAALAARAVSVLGGRPS